MNASYGFCRCRRCLCATLLVLMLVLLPLTARADEAAVRPKDPTESTAVSNDGNITVLLKGDADGSGLMMTGGTISLYRVAMVNRDDSNDCFYDTSRGQFATSEVVVGIGSMSTATRTRRVLSFPQPVV